MTARSWLTKCLVRLTSGRFNTGQRFIRERLIPAENHLEKHDDVPPNNR